LCVGRNRRRLFSRVSAEALGISDARERQFFGVGEIPHDLAIEQTEFLKQGRMTVVRQRLHEIFDHRSQPSHNLQIVRPTGADLAECQMYEVLPVGGAENHPQLSGFAEDLVGAEIASSDHAQHAVELVDCEDSRGRIVDGRRQRLQRDIDGDPKRKGGVLVDGAFRTESGQAM
jgi:hypothetical protein